MDWFRWHHGSVSDPKFRLIARKSGASVATVIAVWASLLEEASKAADRGNAGNPDFDAMDCALEIEEGTSKRVYGLMCERGLIEATAGRIVRWDARQPKRERDDDSASRVRAFREKKRQSGQCNASETPCNASETQETPRGEEIREEKKKEKDAASPGAAAPDPIFGVGLEFLVRKGIKPAGARSFLGLLRKEIGDVAVAELLARADADDVSDPLAWLRAAAAKRKAESRQRSPGLDLRGVK